jgi:hypothetical protein
MPNVHHTVITTDQSKAVGETHQYEVSFSGRSGQLVEECVAFEPLQKLERSNPEVKYEIKEHIDFCFTCMMKTLPLEQQIVLMLKNIYGFKVDEIKIIVNKTEPAVKNLLHQARKTLIEIFENRCSMGQSSPLPVRSRFLKWPSKISRWSKMLSCWRQSTAKIRPLSC